MRIFHLEIRTPQVNRYIASSNIERHAPQDYAYVSMVY